MKLYLDADVWLNFWLDEMLGFLPASHYTEELLDKALIMKWIIVVSDLVRDEISKKKIASTDLEEKLNKLRQAGLVEEIEATPEDRAKAIKLSMQRHLHLSDALHAILVIKTGATIVTRNIKDFEVVKDLVKVLKPEDLL